MPAARGPADVLRLVVGRGLGLTAAGLGLGLEGEDAFGFLLSHVLYGVERVAAGVLVPDPAPALRHD